MVSLLFEFVMIDLVFKHNAEEAVTSRNYSQLAKLNIDN